MDSYKQHLKFLKLPYLKLCNKLYLYKLYPYKLCLYKLRPYKLCLYKLCFYKLCPYKLYLYKLCPASKLNKNLCSKNLCKNLYNNIRSNVCKNFVRTSIDNFRALNTLSFSSRRILSCNFDYCSST